MNDELQNILQILKQNTAVLANEFKVQRFGVFGSVARGDQHVKSDVDILVDLSEPIGLFKFVELEYKLKNLLGGNVDLVTRPAPKPLIKENILRQTVYV